MPIASVAAGTYSRREIILSIAESSAAVVPLPRVVLVVEDETLVRYPLAEHLREAGWVVVETHDAAEAMQVITSGTTVDIAFVDFKLPGGLTGYMFAQWLAGVRPTVPVLLTSGLTSRAPGFVEGGLRRYIAKPYALEDVSRMLLEMSISGTPLEMAIDPPAIPVTPTHFEEPG